MSSEDGRTKRLVEELRVYQLELETQNDELRRSQSALRESREKKEAPLHIQPIDVKEVLKSIRREFSAPLHGRGMIRLLIT